jgi:hypothetical protein
MIDMGNRQRRPDPKMTVVIASAVITELVAVLSWLSQDSGGPLRWWQIPALVGTMILPAGWIVISQSGAAPKRANEINLRAALKQANKR